MQRTSFIPDVSPIIDYFRQTELPGIKSPPSSMNGSFLIFPMEYGKPQESDAEESEKLITDIMFFLEKNCSCSRLDFSLLGVRPLTYETCILAQSYIKQFYAFFRIENSDHTKAMMCDSRYGSLSLSEFVIQESSLMAWTRYTNELKLKGDNARLAQRVLLGGGSSTQKKNSPNHSIQQSSIKTCDSKERQCYDNCNLF